MKQTRALPAPGPEVPPGADLIDPARQVRCFLEIDVHPSEQTAIGEQTIVFIAADPIIELMLIEGIPTQPGRLFLNEDALAEFQASVGISPALGNFGPITRAYLKSNY